MIINTINKNHGAESVHYFNNEVNVFTKFDKVFIEENSSITEIQIPIKWWKKIVGNLRILRRLLRIDQYTIKLVGKDKQVLVIINDGNVYYYDKQKKILQLTLKLKQCKQLLKNSICETKNGELFFGEYGQNKKRLPIPIYKSTDKGKSWKIVYNIEAKKARHVHGCFWDNFENKIWILTGDFKDENHFICVDKEFKKIEWIGDGTQKFRACNLFFEENYIYWITDSELEKNYLYKLKRENRKYLRLQPFPGPVWYTKKINENNYLASITCEKGPGSHPNYGFIYHSKNLEKWNKVMVLEKDFWPKKYFKNGVISFSDGRQKINSFEISGEGFKYFDGNSHICEILSINKYVKKFVINNILDLNKLSLKDGYLASNKRKFSELDTDDLIHLIQTTDYNDIDIKLSEKILKFCEVKNNSSSEIYNNFKGNHKIELLITVLLLNYSKFDDLRYLNVVLKILDNFNNSYFSQKNNKSNFKSLVEILISNKFYD